MKDPFKQFRKSANANFRRVAGAVISNAFKANAGLVRQASKPVKPRPAAAKPAKPAPAKAAKAAPAKARKPVVRGTSFKSGRFQADETTIAYKLYIPSCAAKSMAPLPLVVMLHGCNQTADDFARGTQMNAIAEEMGFVVLYPSQSRKVQIHGCWAWFKPENQMRGSGEPAVLASLVQDILKTQRVDAAKVYVAGLSAGGAMALILATSYPDIFAAVGVHSGLAVGAAHNPASVVVAMQAGNPGRAHDNPMPTIIFHGAVDKVVHPRNGRFVALRALAPYMGLTQTVVTGRSRGGHRYSRTRHRIGTGRPFIEQWVIEEAGHAWSGGDASARYTDPAGPNASKEMARFFLRHRTTQKRRRALA
jgi:poly(hydroxyalkanoate) depolymerase family esterase